MTTIEFLESKLAESEKSFHDFALHFDEYVKAAINAGWDEHKAIEFIEGIKRDLHDRRDCVKQLLREAEQELQ